MTIETELIYGSTFVSAELWPNVLTHKIAPYEATCVAKRLFMAARKLKWCSLMDHYDHKARTGKPLVRIGVRA